MHRLGRLTVATCFLLSIVLCGCRVSSPQRTLREGFSWIKPSFPYLNGTYQRQLQLQVPSPNVHDIQYYDAGYSSAPPEHVSGPPEHYYYGDSHSQEATHAVEAADAK